MVCAHSVSFVASGALALHVRVHMVTRARLTRAHVRACTCSDPRLARERRPLTIVNVAQMTRVRSTGTRPVTPTPPPAPPPCCFERARVSRTHPLPLRAVVDDAFLGDGVHTWCCCAWRAYVVLLHMACHGAQAPLFSAVAQMAQNKVLVCVHVYACLTVVCVCVRVRACLPVVPVARVRACGRFLPEAGGRRCQCPRVWTWMR